MRRNSLRAEAPVPGPLQMLRHGLPGKPYSIQTGASLSVLTPRLLLRQHDQFTCGSAFLADSNGLACSAAGDRPGWSSGPQLRWRCCSQWLQKERPCRDLRPKHCTSRLLVTERTSRAYHLHDCYVIRTRRGYAALEATITERRCSSFWLLLCPSTRVTEAVECSNKSRARKLPSQSSGHSAE